MKIPPSKSILPNSSPKCLEARRNAQGTFQVAWIEQIDSHGLFCEWADGRGVSLLATHHNGHSCAALADRICSGDAKRAEEQREFIMACGGTAQRAEAIAYATTGE